MRGVDVPFFTTAKAATTFKASVGIGTPPTLYTLIVDTGSANTWIAARGPHSFKPTETSKETDQALYVKYGTGCFRGKLWFDRVTLGSLVIVNQGIGVAENVFGFEEDVDGILGLGLSELTKESFAKDSHTDGRQGTIPTIVDNLFDQGKIQQKTLAISFDRMSTTLKSKDYAGAFHGIMTFGGTDSSRYSGDVTYAPIPQDKPSSKHWSFEQRITYGYPTVGEGGIEILKNGIGVIDTGSSVVHLTHHSFDAYRNATRANLNYFSGLLLLSEEEKRREMKSLFFEIGGRIFEIPPEEQLWPQELNEVAGGPRENVYLTYVELLSDNGVKISLINGFTWLQQFYIVLDVENKRIGFAKAASPLTSQDTAIRETHIRSAECTTNKLSCVNRGSSVLGTLRKYSSFILSYLSSTFSLFRFPYPAELRLRLSNMSSRSQRDTDSEK